MTEIHGHEAALNQLGEVEIYRLAMTFASQSAAQEVLADRNFGSQVNGLLQFSASWDELLGFVKHQEERNWQGSKEAYKRFYSSLKEQLHQIQANVKGEYHLIPDGLSASESRAQQNAIAGVLAREFVQHLYAELLYRKEVK